jgi:hypothetical protein
MRSDSLTAADWAVIIDYVDVLWPLKVASERLEGRGKKQYKLYGRFGVIYEIIPMFEQLIAAFEERLVTWESVDFEQLDAPEDHMAINLCAAVAKLKLYYSKLSDSPAYYAAIALHPRLIPLSSNSSASITIAQLLARKQSSQSHAQT